MSVNSCSFVKVSEHLIKSTHLLNFLNSYLTCPDQNVPQDSLATGQHSLITPRRRGTGVNILPPRQKVTRLIFENCNKYHMMFSRIKRHTAEKFCINFDKCASNQIDSDLICNNAATIGQRQRVWATLKLPVNLTSNFMGTFHGQFINFNYSSDTFQYFIATRS